MILYAWIGGIALAAVVGFFAGKQWEVGNTKSAQLDHANAVIEARKNGIKRVVETQKIFVAASQANEDDRSAIRKDFQEIADATAIIDRKPDADPLCFSPERMSVDADATRRANAAISRAAESDEAVRAGSRAARPERKSDSTETQPRD